jgi:hypothetical protein
MNYIEKHKASGIKVGDKVKVTRIAASSEQGWKNAWVYEMDSMVGEILEVVSDDGSLGFDLRDNETNDSYQFPHFVLEKVQPAASPCQNHDSEGYDEAYMDMVATSNYWDNIATPEYWGNIDSVGCSDPQNTTATLTFNLEDQDSYEMFQVYAQAQRLYNFSFEVANNMYRILEWELDNDPNMNGSEMLERVRQHIDNLLQSHKIDIE